MTKEYYSKNAKAFIERTLNVDMTAQYSLFEKHLPTKGKILDIGFGSGRDSLYFSKNYEVVSIDNCEAFIDEGKKTLNNEVLLMDVREMNSNKEFEGIWANASLLHIPFNELSKILDNCFKALKDNGVMYMSFKYGDYEGIRNGRNFTDLNEKRLENLLINTRFKLREANISKDVRPGKSNEKWMNVILIK